MVKITLYNIGGYKKKQVFYCFVGFFCIHSLYSKYSKNQKKICIWEEEYKCFDASYTPPTGTGTNAYHPATFYDIRFPTQHLHYI